MSIVVRRRSLPVSHSGGPRLASLTSIARRSIWVTRPRRMANLNVQIPSLKLNDGTSIPLVGYGSKSQQ